MLLRAVLKAKNEDLELSHFGIDEDEGMDKAEFDKLIEELQKK